MPLLFLLAAAAFVSAFSNRILDPLVPSMARSLHVEVATAALLSSAYTFPYAISQPFLGALGDQLGKERILKICIGALAIALVGAAIAPNYGTLLAARMLSGIAGGGIIPVAFAIIGDRIPVAERQSALARLVMASQMAILLGSALSGIAATHFSWRAIFALAALIGVVSFVATTATLPSTPRAATSGLSVARVREQYASVVANPFAATLLAGVAVEGMTMFGLFPYVADRLETRGFGGAWEAGIVIAGMSIGGIAYTLLIRQLLRQFGVEGMIRMGGIVSATAMAAIAFSPNWQAEALAFGVLGFGFFSIHNSLQLQATELAPTARASSVALFAFCFFLGQASGPVLYQLGFAALGVHWPIVIGGLLLLAVSLIVARRLETHRLRRP